jgi:ferredoxin
MCLSADGEQLSSRWTGGHFPRTGDSLFQGSATTVPVKQVQKDKKLMFRPVLRNALKPRAVKERKWGMYATGQVLYGVRYIDPAVKLKRPDREKDAGIGKCTFCDHRVDKGIEPSCVQACPHKARSFGDMNDPGSKVSKLIKEFNLDKNKNKTTLLPQEKTMPHVFYIDPEGILDRYKFDYKDKGNRLAEYRDNII